MEREKRLRQTLMPTLPDDMILEILLRLPPKSLYRFCSVSQSWRSVLCSNFIRSRDKNKGNLFLLFPKKHTTLDCFEAAFDAAADAISVETAEYPFKFEQFVDRQARLRLYASCDSWLLVGKLESSELWLFNPSTGENKEFQFFYGHPIYFITFFGICYDGSQDEYKVVSVTRRTDSDIWFFSVFSFKTRSWIEVKDFPFQIEYYEGPGMSVDGAPHWICYRYSDDANVILSFDVEEEKFIEVPKPRGLDFPFDLTVMGGNLIAYSDQPRGALKIWEMKEYRVKESWVPVFHIGQSENVRRPLAMTITRGGELIIASEYRRKLYIYNDKKGELKALMDFEWPVMFEAAPYIGSSN